MILIRLLLALTRFVLRSAYLCYHFRFVLILKHEMITARVSRQGIIIRWRLRSGAVFLSPERYAGIAGQESDGVSFACRGWAFRLSFAVGMLASFAGCASRSNRYVTFRGERRRRRCRVVPGSLKRGKARAIVGFVRAEDTGKGFGAIVGNPGELVTVIVEKSRG